MPYEPIEFVHTSFYNGWNATFGKITIKLNIGLEFMSEDGFLRIELFTGVDKLYRINDIGEFLERLDNLQPLNFSKYFILEPERMCYEELEHRFLEFLKNLKLRRQHGNMGEGTREADLHDKEITLYEAEKELFLDTFWESMKQLPFSSNSKNYSFRNHAPIKVSIEKGSDCNLMIADYSEYGDFTPVTKDFRYLIFRKHNVLVKLPGNSRELFQSLYPYKNNESQVMIRIHRRENKIFQKNLLEKYRGTVKIILDPAIEREIQNNSLISKVYFDVAGKGVISKIEFCYGDNIINPLEDTTAHREFREYDVEKLVIEEMERYGFTEYGRLYLLNEVEKIITLLTEEPKSLKAMAQVYYSQDFKKLSVKHLSIDSFRLSEDGSVIHMNLNLENVSDEELAELLSCIKEKKKYYRLRSGSIVNLNSVDSSVFTQFINGLDINRDKIHNGLFEIPLNRCMYVEQYLQEKGMDQVTVDSRLGGILHKLKGGQEASAIPEATINGILRDYQQVGVQWLQTMAQYSFGGILADDMGLGKTLQVLAFLSSNKTEILPCLVVAPTSLLYNWKQEAERFVPDKKVIIITGPRERRRLLLSCCNEYDLIITSYGVLKNDIDQYKEISFSYIIVDEAQNIKNPMTLNSGSVKSLRAKCCFALTGTPIENRLMELWSIFDFIMPGYLLSRKQFEDTYEEPILRGKNKDKMQELSRLVNPFILRRMKKDVLDELPDKIVTNYISEMTEQQEKLYAAYYKEFKKELEVQLDRYGMERSQIEILSALTRLRQICAHPGTFLEDYDGGSGKLLQAMELISDAINAGHSILVFSQFTKLLRLLEAELRESRISYYYLDGTMKPEERKLEIDNFNSDREAVFLISLKAGGTGLNLTKADTIIHFDPWWNPAVEDQASDRAHRIGQKKVVQVYKLITEGTIEEKIAELQEKKRNLIESVIKPGENFWNQLSEEEIKELLGIHDLHEG
ncbi:MAG TPA: SNF2-related protein [Mobilitalea sp.]|nr:SNF2-related protein [Mobilitalea sp.]